MISGPTTARSTASRTSSPTCRALRSPPRQTRQRRAEIVEHLKIGAENSFVAGFDRPNIRYGAAEKTGTTQQMLRFLEPRKGESGIVYCLSKRKTEEVAASPHDHGHHRAALPRRHGNEGAGNQPAPLPA